MSFGRNWWTVLVEFYVSLSSFHKPRWPPTRWQSANWPSLSQSSNYLFTVSTHHKQRHIHSFYSLVAAYMATTIGDGICLANVVFLESLPSTPLNGSLRNCNTWRVSVGNSTKQSTKIFWVLAPKHFRFKTTYFRRLRSFRIAAVDISKRIFTKL